MKRLASVLQIVEVFGRGVLEEVVLTDRAWKELLRELGGIEAPEELLFHGVLFKRAPPIEDLQRRQTTQLRRMGGYSSVTRKKV